MHIHLPDKVKKIIETIESGGYEAYAVGGCVRDSILGRVPDDWDITTSASPQEIKKPFPPYGRYGDSARNGDGHHGAGGV